MWIRFAVIINIIAHILRVKDGGWEGKKGGGVDTQK